MERSQDDGTDQEPPEDSKNDVSEFVEVDPTGRYGRYDEVLGKGAYKTVYKAFDDLDGIEVAWNQVKLQDMVHKGGDMERLYSELHLLKTLKHKNIIKFYNSWVDTRNKNVNFITEIFTSGTLRQYRKKHKHVNLRAIKHWSRQILQGLVYLHNHNPPIIHRDLKCDNIFINGNNGEVKIGDLGLATILRQAPAAHSVIGTPEFMAPELYEEHYNELVDIYSFGMCLLEMLTSEYPYSECANAAQIYKKGKRPAALSKVKDPETRKFVEKCLASAPQRLHARELLFDPFLRNDEDYEVSESSHRSTTLNHYEDMKCLDPVPEESYRRSSVLGASAQNPRQSLLDSQSIKLKQGGIEENAKFSESPHAHDFSQSKEGGKRNRDFRIKGRKQDDKKVLVRIRITSSTGGVRYIQFDFDVEVDTAMSVASEMVTELELSDQDVTTIADMIDAEISSLIPDWKPRILLDGPGDSESMNEQPGPIRQNSMNELATDEESILHSDPTSSTLGSADDIEVEDVPRNEAFNMYGRFEEVDCGQNESDLNHKEQDGSGFLSDYSSEPHEGGRSDTSLEVSLDNRSSAILTSQMLEEIRNDPCPSSMSMKASEHEENGDIISQCIPSLVSQCETDNDDDSEVLKFLIMQHERELRLLQSKHEQALLDFKAQRREASKVASTCFLEGKPSLTLFDASRETLTSMNGNYEYCNKEDCERNTEVSENSNFNTITPIGTPDSIISTSENELLLSTVQANNGSAQAENSSVMGIDPGSSHILSSGGGSLSKITREQEAIVAMKDMPIQETVKPSMPLLTKRESYLELYKGQSNQRDKPVSPKPSEVPCTSDGISEEQLKKQQLQKSIAELEAKTLEGLLQSKSKYTTANAPKNNTNTTVQNGQGSSSGANGRQSTTQETTKV